MTTAMVYLLPLFLALFIYLPATSGTPVSTHLAEPAPRGTSAPPLQAAEATPVASYDIKVRLDTGSKQLAGEEIITYTNTTTEPIPDLVFHLYLNAFRSADTFFLREMGGQHRGFGWDAENPGWIRVEAIQLVDGPALDLAEIEDGTLARADLPEPVQPGQTIQIALEFTAQLPRVFARTGFAGEDFFMVGQWFPKLGVWQEGAWNAYPFYPDAEFYADFGNYRVEITLPAAYVTGGTGLPVATMTHGDGSQTIRYEAEGVIDFAWTASPHFLEASRRVGEVELLYLYLPGHEWTVERALAAGEAALTHYSRWYGPYPYARLTVVDVPDEGQGAGGMEYPTLVTAGALIPTGPTLSDERPDRLLELVIVHEIGHQWWQSVVAFNEAEEPWLDEGFTDYSTLGVMEAAYGAGTSVIDVGPLELGYLDMRRSEYLASARTPMYGRAWELPNYEVATYAKPVLALTTLERVLGEETMLAVMSAFYQRYRFAHPTTEDFRAVAEEVSGRDLTWFFETLVYGDGVLNYAVKEVTEHGATIVRQGTARVPVEVRVVFTDNSAILEHWSGQESELSLSYPDRSPIWSVEIDPARKVVMDLRWADNSLSRDLTVRPWLALVTRLLYTLQSSLLFLGGL